MPDENIISRNFRPLVALGTASACFVILAAMNVDQYYFVNTPIETWAAKSTATMGSLGGLMFVLFVYAGAWASTVCLVPFFLAGGKKVQGRNVGGLAWLAVLALLFSVIYSIALSEQAAGLEAGAYDAAANGAFFLIRALVQFALLVPPLIVIYDAFLRITTWFQARASAQA